MTTQEGRAAVPFEHLFAEAARSTMGDSPYGAWRSIGDEDAVSLSFGFPFPDALPADELAAVTETVLAEDGARVLQYGGGEDADRLPDRIVDLLDGHGIDRDPAAIEPTNGATHAIDVICRAFLDPGDPVAVESPTFMGALGVFRNYGAEIIGVDADADGIDVAALERELRDRRERGDRLPPLVYTIPTFQNPTGTTLTDDRRDRLLDLAAEFDFVVIEDDAYADLRYDGDDVVPLAARGSDRVLHVGTFSKTIAPGVRTGWIDGPEPVVDQLRRLNPGGTNTLTQSVVARYCVAGSLEENVRQLRAAYRDRRDHMLAALDRELPAGATWTEPDGGFFVWVELPGVDTADLLSTAVEEGVVYLPGTMFYADGRESNALRLSFSYASPDEMDRAVAALGRAARDATE
jgi:2-aminoadipate transaminase